MTAAEKHWTVKGTVELNQRRSFRDVLTLKWNSKIVLHSRSSVFVSPGNERLWIHSRLIEIRFDWRRPLENLGYRHKEINQEKLQDK